MTVDMARDKSWEAVLDPGKATDFFAAPGNRPVLQAELTEWHLGNAWWCSEISRTIYRRDGRAEFFRAVDLRELQFFDAGSTQASLVHGGTFAVLAFRGTQNLRDWWTNVRVATTEWPPGGLVHEGFARALGKVWDQIATALDALQVPTLVTGHSLGGALATLASCRRAFAVCYTFGAPRVGDAAFYATLQCPVHRVVNDRDIVPTLPPRRFGYTHGGVLHHIAADGTLLRDPTEQDLAEAKASLADRRWFEPHEALSDHAPINYSALLNS
tara:strand:- start:15467 stop:16279 length:813 start_codon:yes stop_codon:yes gene_type:complete